jgi:hypothetical protein
LRLISFEDHVAQELARASFAPQRYWLRRGTLSLGLLSLLALLSILIVQAPLWPALVLAGLALLSGLGLIYYEWRYRCYSRRRGQLSSGLRGQRRMTKLLGLLDDDYYLINNLKLPDRADDVDHLVVGPNGVFALETKNHRGRIFWREGQWYQSKVSRSGHLQPETPIRDPSQQLKRNVDYLRSCINHTDRELSRRTRLWIEGAAVFTHPAVSLDLPPEVTAALPFPVLRARDLPAHIVGHVPRHTYTKADVRQIVDLFGRLQPPASR